MLTIVLYEPIGEGDAAAKAVLLAMGKAKPDEAITVAINSPGGSVFEGEAIYNALKRHKGRVTARVDGLAASAASYIMCAADEIIFAPGAHAMIHSPMAQTGGNQEELRSVIDKLEVLERQYCRVYAQRTGQDEARVREWMRAETWFTAEQALQAGLADKIDDGLRMAAVIPGDFARLGYRHVPVAVKALNDPQASLSGTLAAEKIEAARPEPTAAEKAEAESKRLRRQRQRRRMALLAEMRPNL